MAISTSDMSHDEWLEIRRKGIGGSDAGAICGLNKYRSAFEVYADKLGLIPPKADTEPMRQGRDLEEYVAERFCEETGKKVRRRNAILQNSEYPFAFANVDRLIVGENAGLECKTANSLNLKRYKNGEYPSEYYCQCMHYMAVTGYKKWYLAVLIFSTEFKVFEIERDEDEIAALMDMEREFWERNVLKKIPPAPTGTQNDSAVINYMHPRDNDGNIALLGFDAKLKKYTALKEQIARLEAEKSQIEQEVKLYMGDAKKAENDRFKVIYPTAVRRTLNSKKLIEDYLADEDLSDYYKETTYRTLKITEV